MSYKKKEDEIIFRQAFDLFWQNPKFQEKTRNMLLPRTRVSEQEEQKEELAQRIRENLPKTEKIKKLDELEDNIIFDTSGSASDIQLNKSRDFGTMSKNELRQATDVIEICQYTCLKNHFVGLNQGKWATIVSSAWPEGGR